MNRRAIHVIDVSEDHSPSSYCDHWTESVCVTRRALWGACGPLQAAVWGAGADETLHRLNQSEPTGQESPRTCTGTQASRFQRPKHATEEQETLRSRHTCSGVHQGIRINPLQWHVALMSPVVGGAKRCICKEQCWNSVLLSYMDRRQEPAVNVFIL